MDDSGIAEFGLRIGPLVTSNDFKAAERLQQAVWTGSDVEVVPLHLLLTIGRNGGLVLGAWDGDALVGYLLGFLGTDQTSSESVATTRLKHCSHQLGVHPDYRDRRIGYRLKLAQREVVLKQGLQLATWTYDPLETRNANLNLRRLGGIVREYKRNYYGEMEDDLNAGLPSDRFQVEWWLASHRVRERVEGTRPPVSLEQYRSAELRVVNPSAGWETGLLQPGSKSVELGDAMLALVEVPTNFQEIKSADPQLALKWRLHTRAVFEGVFTAGYMLTDFVVDKESETGPRGFYVLSFSEAIAQYDDTFGKN